MRRQHLFDGQQRQVGIVLVIDRVELHLFDQVQQVRELEGQHALGLENVAEAADEGVQVRHMGQDIVGCHQVGLLAARRQRLGGLNAEKSHLGAHALGAGGFGGVAGRLDPQHRHAARKEVFQEIAVVTGDLDDQGVCAQTKPLDHRLGIAFGVRHPAGRIGREIGIGVVEDRLGRHLMIGLDQKAGVTDQGAQREDRLITGDQLFRRQIAVGQGLQTQVQKHPAERRAAESAETHHRAS